MKKALVLMLLVTMVIALVVIAGCGKEETTVETTEEKTTVEEKDSETVDKRGSEVTEEDVGSPFYPGAEIDEESANYSSDGEVPHGDVTMCSSDSIEEVVQWYRDNLKGYEEVEALTGAKFEKVEKATPFDIRYAVAITGHDGKVLIVVSVGREFD